MLEIPEISQIAAETRERFEVQAIPRAELRAAYERYNPDIIDPERFLDAAAAMFPNGNCGLASAYLRDLLGFGVEGHGRFMGFGHTVLKLADNFGIDITADQYGGPRIFVGEFEHPWDFS